MNRCYSARSSLKNLEITGIKNVFVHGQDLESQDLEAKFYPDMIILTVQLFLSF